MNSKTFNLPDAIWFDIPKDYAKFCGGDPVRVLEETSKGGFTIQWDDDFIQFLGKKGGVSYRRSAIQLFNVDRNVWRMHWRICQLEVGLKDGLVPIFCAHAKDQAVFDEFMKVVMSANLPFQISENDSA